MIHATSVAIAAGSSLITSAGIAIAQLSRNGVDVAVTARLIATLVKSGVSCQSFI